MDTLGIPQGSHIGPILYLIYCNDIINEISKEAPSVKVVQFADDTKIMIEVVSKNSRIELQKAIKVIKSWSVLNAIPLNMGKTLYLSIGKSNNQYYLDDFLIPAVVNATDLGLLYDEKLNFKAHENLTILRAKHTTTKSY